MPIYEYRCNACKHSFERLIRNQKQSVSCPDCGSADVQRIMSSFGFRKDAKESSLNQPNNPSGSSCASCVSRNCSQCR
ncbi:MAG: FmdB family zinc ribbon protein [bacterium]